MAQERSVAELIARVAELEHALDPFAKAAIAFAGRHPTVRLISTATGDITVASLLMARAVRYASDE